MSAPAGEASLVEEAALLRSHLLAWMGAGWGEEGGVASDETFDPLALRILRFQARANPVYGALLRNRGLDAARLEHWSRFPLVPARAFREVPPWLGALPGEAEAVFRTSGTTATRPGERGEHRVRDLALYRASLLPPALHFLGFGWRGTPGKGEEEKVRVLSLLPDPNRAPDSSLAFMAGALHDALDDGAGGFFLGAGGAPDLPGFVRAVGEAREAGVPVLLLATAFALVHLLDEAAGGGALALPAGSRVMETGGFKGRSREVPRGAFYEALGRAFRLPLRQIVNEYGMTEMLSQFWEPVLVEGGDASPEARRHLPPPWVRTRILDPATLRPVAPGEPGLLAHLDLANLFSASPLLTEDMGVAVSGPGPGHPPGFRVLGRSAGALPRGCSLTMEAWLEARS